MMLFMFKNALKLITISLLHLHRICHSFSSSPPRTSVGDSPRAVPDWRSLRRRGLDGLACQGLDSVRFLLNRNIAKISLEKNMICSCLTTIINHHCFNNFDIRNVSVPCSTPARSWPGRRRAGTR